MNAPGQERWIRLWREAALRGDPVRPYQELIALYSQAHRHYHNLRHLAECLAEFDSARRLARQPAAVELAIWFHDAIYDPRAHDNEEQSATLAERRLAEAGATPDLCASVAALILATKTHESSACADAALLIDLDLIILGQPPERFREYEAQIRREYEWVPEAAFAAKRSEVLERFLARARIYTTDFSFAKYEQSARTNLQDSLRRLKPGLNFRAATVEDCGLLAELNHQLIQDEGHRNRMTVPQLEERMRSFLQGEYRAIIYEDGGEVIAYALYREESEEIYLRQLFVVRHRRRQGIGRCAVEILRSEVWPKHKRLTVDVLVANQAATAFWRAVGYRDYSLMLEIMPEKQP